MKNLTSLLKVAWALLPVSGSTGRHEQILTSKKKTAICFVVLRLDLPPLPVIILSFFSEPKLLPTHDFCESIFTVAPSKIDHKLASTPSLTLSMYTCVSTNRSQWINSYVSKSNCLCRVSSLCPCVGRFSLTAEACVCVFMCLLLVCVFGRPVLTLVVIHVWAYVSMGISPQSKFAISGTSDDSAVDFWPSAHSRVVFCVCTTALVCGRQGKHLILRGYS